MRAPYTAILLLVLLVLRGAPATQDTDDVVTIINRTGGFVTSMRVTYASEARWDDVDSIAEDEWGENLSSYGLGIGEIADVRRNSLIPMESCDAILEYTFELHFNGYLISKQSMYAYFDACRDESLELTPDDMGSIIEMFKPIDVQQI